MLNLFKKIILAIIIAIINYFILIRWPLYISQMDILYNELKNWGDPMIIGYIISFLVFVFLEYILYKNSTKKESIIATIVKFISLPICFFTEFLIYNALSNPNDPTSNQGYGWLLILTIIPSLIDFSLLMISSTIGIINSKKPKEQTDIINNNLEIFTNEKDTTTK